jgi:hypothetical protein
MNNTYTEKQQYFYELGFDRGKSMASDVDFRPLGDPIPTELGDCWNKEIDSLDTAASVAASEAYLIEEYNRQFSPFEFTAKEINDYEHWSRLHNREDLSGWEPFDTGISDGITYMINHRKKKYQGDYDE